LGLKIYFYTEIAAIINKPATFSHIRHMAFRVLYRGPEIA